MIPSGGAKKTKLIMANEKSEKTCHSERSEESLRLSDCSAS
jgi:hypothetical protein